MNNPWNDELRAYLLRWLMEFGDGWVTPEAREQSSWYQDSALNAYYQTVNWDPEYPQEGPVAKVFESQAPRHKIWRAHVRLNERALDFLKGESDGQRTDP